MYPVAGRTTVSASGHYNVSQIAQGGGILPNHRPPNGYPTTSAGHRVPDSHSQQRASARASVGDIILTRYQAAVSIVSVLLIYISPTTGFCNKHGSPEIRKLDANGDVILQGRLHRELFCVKAETTGFAMVSIGVNDFDLWHLHVGHYWLKSDAAELAHPPCSAAFCPAQRGACSEIRVFGIRVPASFAPSPVQWILQSVSAESAHCKVWSRHKGHQVEADLRVVFHPSWSYRPYHSQQPVIAGTRTLHI